jgi:hypothetical protein
MSAQLFLKSELMNFAIDVNHHPIDSHHGILMAPVDNHPNGAS